MKDYQTWLEEHNQDMPSKNIHKNKRGGTEPITPEQIKIFKKVDLITLPESVEGTNCFNCRYSKKDNKDIRFCSHKEIKQYVSNRNCCALWDHKDVKRAWKK